jgi:biopolymer transport protein ExbB/TolQ
MNILHLISTGGFVMYPLIIFSIIVWAIFFERLWFLKQFKNNYLELNSKVSNLGDKRHELRGMLESTDLALRPTYCSLLEQGSADQKESIYHRRLQEVYHQLKGPIWTLATIASAAPFVGLFGTVIGIIKSFEDIAKTGKGGFSVVAAGLSEALVATATGIIVAVISVLLYNYLMSRINNLNIEFKNRFLDLAAQLRD